MSTKFVPKKTIATAKVKEAGTFLDIQLMDHLIISPEGYCSMADEGFM